MTNETKPKGNREAGRPRGSKNRARFATKALEKLDMSPLSDLLRLLNEHYIRVHDNDRSNAPSTKHTGELLHYLPENNVYVYFRSLEDQTVMVVLNNNPEEQTLDLSRFAEGIKNATTGKELFSQTH